MTVSVGGALFWSAVVCCLAAQIAITAAAARPPRPVEAEGDVPLPHRTAEVAWSLVPAVMLGLVLLLTWNALRLGQAEPTAPAVDAVLVEPRAT
jgi:hypothetical protein